MIRKFLLWFFKKFVLEKHPFAPTDLIYKDGTRVLYEVDSNYYNRNLTPITVVRRYPGGELQGISEHEIIEFLKFKRPTQAAIMTTASDVVSTPHANLKATRRKK